MNLDRVEIVGVVHGQESCIREVKSIIITNKPEVVAIELPPTFNDEHLVDLDQKINKISALYQALFNALASLGIQEKYAKGMESIALGLSLQGVEFLVAIKTAKEVGAKVEFIDIRRDALFWDFFKTYVQHSLSSKKEEKARFNMPGLKNFSFQSIKNFVMEFIDDFKSTWNELLTIYGENDYEKLIHDIIPALKQINDNPFLKETLIEHRNEYMAEKIKNIMNTYSGKIVVITGFGHVDGIKQLLKEKLK
ncbi:MAG: TraB domain-containing protein [Promethearchaeota archaeon]